MATTKTAGGAPAGGAGGRLPSIKERRPSSQKKASNGDNEPATTTTTTATNSQQEESTNATTTTTPSTAAVTSSSATTAAATTTSTTTTSTATNQRRTSVTQGGSNQSGAKSTKPTFAGIGRRVSSMVRARMAFQGRRKVSAAEPEPEPDPIEQIQEMPRNPRFTTFLSPEAQYAMMKGYEDKLYEKIATTNPESRLVLKRNKTPYRKQISFVEDDKKPSESKTGGALTVKTKTNTSHPSDPDAAAEDADEDDPGSLTTRPSRSHTTLAHDVSKSMTSHRGGAGGVGFSLHRSSSLPMLAVVPSHQKRLVLTYRLESAMDILDTLKKQDKENSLSPRVYRKPRKVDAVRDFNCWTRVWNNEFKVGHGK